MSIKITSKHFEQIKTLLENESIKKSSFKKLALSYLRLTCIKNVPTSSHTPRNEKQPVFMGCFCIGR